LTKGNYETYTRHVLHDQADSGWLIGTLYNQPLMENGHPDFFDIVIREESHVTMVTNNQPIQLMPDSG